MTEVESKVAELEATEKKLNDTKAELEASSKSVEEKQKEKAGLDAEIERVRKDIATAKESRRHEDASFQETMRNENVTTASQKLFAEFGIKPEDQAQFLDEFKKFGSSAVSAEAIAADMRRMYARDHAEELLAAGQAVRRLAEGSDEMKAALSSSGFSGVGLEHRGGEQGLTAEEVEAARFAHMTPARYKELKDKGKLD